MALKPVGIRFPASAAFGGKEYGLPQPANVLPNDREIIT